MLKFTSNVIFLIILATFFVVLFLNHQLNLGYTKEDFTGFSSSKMDYKNETGLKTLVPDNNVYYDPINANVIHMNSNMVKVLNGSSSSYNVYDMTSPMDVEAINKLPQTISPSRKTFCYEVVQNQQYLVYIPTNNNSFINIINVKSNDYMNKNIKLVYAANTELNSIMTGTTEMLSLDNSNKLFSTNTNIIFIDGDNIKIIYVGNNEAKTFNKNDKTNISNFITKYNPSDIIDKIENAGICTLYEIIPQQKYLFYLVRLKAICLMVIDVNTSSNAILIPQSAKTIAPSEPISPDKLKVMNPLVKDLSPSMLISQSPNQMLSSGKAPGSQAPGSQAPGAQGPGSQGPGAQGPGSQGPGAQGPGSQAPGSQAPGAKGPGAQTPGAQTPLPEKYKVLDNFKSNGKELFQNQLPKICPKLSTVLLLWYQTMMNKNNAFTPWGSIDGSGSIGDEKRFGNSASAAEYLLPILLSDTSKPSELGKYEELLIANGDNNGSQTPNLKTPDVKLLASLNNLSTKLGWKL